MTDLATRLARIEALSLFSGPLRDALAASVTARSYPADTRVFSEGEAPGDAYVIEQGSVRIQRTTPYGPFVLRELGAGSLFGESVLVEGPERSCDAVTVSAVELLALDAEGVTAAAEHDQRFELALLWALWRSLSRKLRMANERMAEFFDGPDLHGSLAILESAAAASRDVRVGLSAKRDLFEEQKLSPMEINFLATLSREERFAPGQVIFREGDAGEAAFVVLDGKVMISKSVAGAGEEALAFLERGSYFGEMALIDRLPRSATARAHDVEAVVLAISRDVLGGILDVRRVSSARLLQLLCTMVAGRLREAEGKLVGWHILSAGAGGGAPAGLRAAPAGPA